MSFSWPEHEVACYLSGNGVVCLSVLSKMNPLRTYAQHKLGFARQGTRLLEEQVSIPLRRVPRVERGYARFKFQPILYRRNLRRKVRREGRGPSVDIPAHGCPKL